MLKAGTCLLVRLFSE